MPDLTPSPPLLPLFHPTVFPAVLSSSAGACATGTGCGAFLQGPAAFGSSNGTVREDDSGFWLEAGWNALFYGVPFRGNIGGRYVETNTDSQGIAFNSTVMPVIIRGASLLGIASAGTARDLRDRIWRHLANDWKPQHLDSIATRETGLDELPGVFARMLAGESFGRTLVRIDSTV